jgi:hypothetical protein
MGICQTSAEPLVRTSREDDRLDGFLYTTKPYLVDQRSSAWSEKVHLIGKCLWPSQSPRSSPGAAVDGASLTDGIKVPYPVINQSWPTASLRPNKPQEGLLTPNLQIGIGLQVKAIVITTALLFTSIVLMYP